MANQRPAPAGEFILYQTEDGHTRVECRFADATLWLSQAGMVELFQTSKQNIAKHLKAIFGEGELAPDSVVNSWLTTAADGKGYRVKHALLEAEGERQQRKAPENAAKKLPRPKKDKR